MSKKTTKFVCENCGNSESKWLGKCPVCGAWNTYTEEQVLETENKSLRTVFSGNVTLQKLNEFDLSESARIKTKLKEFDRALGGGIIEEEVILLGGAPGIGKSTLLLQVLTNLANKYKSMYISGEESGKQVALRANRLFKNQEYKDIQFLATGRLEIIIDHIEKEAPQIVVIDSIQTLFDEELKSLPGSLAQVKNCAAKLTTLAKTKGFVLVIIGHINKEGDIAGPKVLEHLVDCILLFEGDSNLEYRVIRTIKNRFGATGEVGIFKMDENGLKDIELMDNLFSVSSEKEEIGVAKTFIIEGNRPVVLDIQALTNTTVFPYPKRVSEGISLSKLQVIAAISSSFKLSSLNNKDVYLRVSGGYQIKNNPNSDLAIIAALISSSKNKPIKTHYIWAGEVSLNGNVFLNSGSALRMFDELKRLSSEYIFVTSEGIRPKITKADIGRFVFIKNIKEIFSIL